MNQVNTANRKHIVVTEATYKRIKALGHFQESFDDVISRLIKEGKQAKVNEILEQEY